jgi:hypothetical protein
MNPIPVRSVNSEHRLDHFAVELLASLTQLIDIKNKINR